MNEDVKTNKDAPLAVVLQRRVIKHVFEKQIKKLEKEIEHHANNQNYGKAAMFGERLEGVISILTRLKIEGIAL